MHVRADLTQPARVNVDDWEWVDSPQAGVRRVLLDRVGDEVAVATSLVRYAPDSRFPDHDHARGEEFIVLEGVFQDEHGDFPAGTYVRNPPTSKHTPGSQEGCTIFVKLWQFDMNDRTQFRKTMAEELAAEVDGVATGLLHKDPWETVTYSHLQPGATLKIADAGGIEVLVIEGSISEGGDTLHQGGWLRLPDRDVLYATAGSEGANVWVKTGHLVHAKAPKLS